MTTAASTLRDRPQLLGLRDQATYRRSLHLMLDLPLGLLTFTAAVTLVALSAGLAVTVIGIPLLIAVLFAARELARAERARARALLGVDVPDAPPAPHGWRGRMGDPAGWRALAYAVLLGPVGLLTGTLTLLLWATALAALGFPAYAWSLADPAVHLGGLTLTGVPAAVGSVLVGLLLLAALPSLVRLLARADAALVGTMLR